MTKTTTTLKKWGAMLLVAAALILLPQAGWSILVLGPEPGNNPQSFVTFTPSQTPGLVGTYELGTQAPVGVEFDAGGPYWVKNLIAQGTNEVTNRPTLQIGDSLKLVEHITIAKGGVTDWHEVITSDGFSWTAGEIYIGGTNQEVAGLSVNINKGDNPLNEHNDNIDFFFDEITAGTQLDIVKVFTFQGISVNAAGGGTRLWGSDTITIREWPTEVIVPEPATMSLVLLGGGGLLGLMRRRMIRK